jgi:hypothetical protein
VSEPGLQAGLYDSVHLCTLGRPVFLGDDEGVKLIPLAVQIIAWSAIAGCSSSPSLTSQFRQLDSDRKIAFLVYYPDLTPGQRAEMLSPDADDPRELIARWNVHPSRAFDDMVKDSRARTIRRIEITQEGSKSGKTLTFHATAHYADQRKVDVTQDVAWSASPPSIDMQGNIAHIACIHSEAVVTANFLDEQQGAIKFRIEKALDFLELHVSDSYLASDQGYNYRLTVIAHCKDGTRADVSCQTDWKTLSSTGRISGCGNLSMSPPNSAREKFSQDPLRVRASYGGLSVTQVLHPPIR